jgi:RNA polymerase sigma factor (TIGR02999 family)
MSTVPQPEHLTILLDRWQSGDEAALNRLTALVHNELHRLAAKLMRSERRQHTLQATALVNEAYINLLNSEVDYRNRLHFFSLAGRMMRRILVDHARARNSIKRGEGQQLLTLTGLHQATENNVDIIALNNAMDALAEFDQSKADMLELHFFAGLNTAEIAELYKVSTKTIERNTRLAKAWLRRVL